MEKKGIGSQKGDYMKKRYVAALFMLISGILSAQQKYALVIGNADYAGVSRLANPVNDANDMEAALTRLGFTVEKVLNGDVDQMEEAVLRLCRRLGGTRNTYGFFFYAGHGVQSGGENYLIPVAADGIRAENQLRSRAVSLQFVLDSMSEAGNELNMVVLDACRDNPFGWARSGSRGLAFINHAPTGSIVMYATGANSTAADGTGRNGLFTGHLLDNLNTPSLSVFEVFDKTMGAVINVTNGRQHPELSLRYAGAASTYLGAGPDTVVTIPASAAQPAYAVTTPTAPPVELPAPTGIVRINGGAFAMGSPANESGRDSDEIQHRVTVGSFYLSKYELTQKEWYDVMGTTVQQQRGKAGGPALYGEGDNYPMYYVSWFEAVQYCNARSRKEGLAQAYTVKISNNNRVVTWNRSANGYRLPTEAEWEYACRAGTTTAYNTGASISGSIGWYDANSDSTTHPVGQKPANAWGLYDMHGNVSEWCWDLYGNYPRRAQTDPTGASSGSLRAARGGSWGSSAGLVRSAVRYGNSPGDQRGNIGFRLARSWFN